jgi:hypothetical protein
VIIQVERSGGFSGIPMLARLDTHNLVEEERQRVEQMVSAVNFFALPERIPAQGRGADRFHYALRVEDERRSHATEVGDADTTPELRDLIQQVMLLARSAHG